MTDTTLQKSAGVSKVFATTLSDVPLFQGALAAVAPVPNQRYPWPHENLMRPGKLNEDGRAIDNDDDDNKNYCMLPDNATANRITNFHRFCFQLPDVMCNYCNITQYPEDVKWVSIGGLGDGQPAACRASTAYAHVPGIEGYAARSTREIDGKKHQYAFCKRLSKAEGRKE